MNCSKLGASVALMEVLASIGRPICMNLTKLHTLVYLCYQALPDEA